MVEVAGGVQVAREKAAREQFDAAIVDVGLPDGSGLDLLRSLIAESPRLVGISMSGQGSIDVAIHAILHGARDFLEKPVSTDRLLLTLKNGLELAEAKAEADTLRAEAGLFEELLGDSPEMARLREMVSRAARASASVLILGERGTGKELVARAIHKASSRAKKPLEKLNCAAVPDNLIESELFGHEAGAFTGATKRRSGKFERAHQGTLFLDEVGDMPLPMQAKLLRVLQEQEVERVGGTESIRVDVRIVAATNRDLTALSAEGAFRADLLDRLHVIPLELPPLRRRRGDIAELSRAFLTWARERNARPEMELTAGAIEALEAYPFPGNVRELRNLMERLVIMTPDHTIEARDVEQALGISGMRKEKVSLFRPGVPFRVLSEEAERTILEEALASVGGQMSKAARVLGLERSHLYKKAKALGLRGEEADSGD